MQGNCYCYCYRQSQKMGNTQYQHIIAKRHKVAPSKTPISSHFRVTFQPDFNPKRSLGFMSEWYLFREDYWRNQRRRSGLRRDDFVSKIPKEMPLWHEKDKTK